MRGLLAFRTKCLLLYGKEVKTMKGSSKVLFLILKVFTVIGMIGTFIEGLFFEAAERAMIEEEVQKEVTKQLKEKNE